MSAGTVYTKRFAGGFVDLPTKTTPVDQQFLNAVEVALLQLIGAAPTADGQVAQWDNVNTRYGPALLLNKNIDPAAAIAKSKLDFTGANGIVDADIAGAAAIAQSKVSGLTTALAAIPPTDGWRSLSALTYGTTDGPTFTVTYGGDLTATVPVGSRVKLTHAAATKYFIVTAHVAGTLTLYGGTTYTLAGTAITNPFFSREKAPVGFPLDPAAWTEKVKNTSNVTPGAATVTTWYNVTSLSLPIGAWYVSYESFIEVLSTSNVGGTVDVVIQATLSTANNTESDTDFTAGSEIWQYAPVGGAAEACNAWLTRGKSLLLAAKTSYFLNMRVQQSSNANFGGISAHGDIDPSIIRAVCAYL